MSKIIIRNKRNPSFTRPFPKRAWDLLGNHHEMKREWEYVKNLDPNDPVAPKSEIQKQLDNGMAKIFIPPEARGMVEEMKGKVFEKPATTPAVRPAIPKAPEDNGVKVTLNLPEEDNGVPEVEPEAEKPAKKRVAKKRKSKPRARKKVPA